jgi:hypothetical protein
MLHTTLAYIDPQSGTLLLQMIIAGAVGTLAFFRNAIFGFFGLFKRGKPKDQPRDGQ